MRSFILTAGLPDERSYATPSNVLHPPSPGPNEFLPALLKELTGLQVAPDRGFEVTDLAEDAVAWVREGSEHDVATWATWGRCGGPAAGFRWRCHGLVDDSQYHSEEFSSYGLPGMALQWSMEWWKSGYAHRFRHQLLCAQFSTETAEALFHDVWQRVFGQPAVLAESRHGD